MKIGLDARAAIWYRGTGIGTYTYQLVKNLYAIDKANQYRFFLPSDISDKLNHTKEKVFQSIDFNKDSFWEEICIPPQIGQEKVDIYHVPQNGIGLPRAKRCLYISTVHDLIPYIYPETTSSGYLKIFLNELHRVMEQSDMILTVSHYSKQEIKRFFNLPDEKIRVIYGAAEDIYKPIEKHKAKKFIKQKYGINSPYLLYVGGLSYRKNVKALILAFWDIQKDINEDYKLVIVGKRNRSFNHLVKITETLNLQDRVIFTGLVPVLHLPFLYNAAELFVYPSLYEGFGLPPLEAMACGTPVITSNTSSIPEVTGDAGVLINPYDELSLATSIEKLINNQNQLVQMSKEGLKQARNYSWASSAQQTLEVYEKLYKTNHMISQH
ncbi:glycosyltransferase family 1 protein [Bacillus sp. V5-8f]|uniref:glycosyltransferase family 4 protein n=1 Tax=Bacillus sp. V5-8f TaxID=2053044 RepID=UPI000C75E21E|nr:glycosyltransferase family 1 protein [Bacillus sp. V5-8f]PLT35490.1 glycosyltransferase family 1 protein [Bacillus sp. V5-8f]